MSRAGVIVLPWPPAILSAHATYGGGHKKAAETKKHREWARTATTAAKLSIGEGDVFLRFTFTPPDNRSDRTNYFNRCKAYIDGIADALGVNDKRFVPLLDPSSYAEPKRPGSVTVEVLG